MDPIAGKCPECGAAVPGDRAGCELLFDEFRFLALSDARLGAMHRLAFDAYCMQHVETYCKSAKSYVAHLIGLCCAVERRGNPAIYAAIPRLLDGNLSLEKPPVLTDRGRLTFLDVHQAPDAAGKVKAIQAWADVVWSAYASQHHTARQWIEVALATPSKR